MEPSSDLERPMKRAKTEPFAGQLSGGEVVDASFATRFASFDPTHSATQSALDHIAALDRDQALALLKSHPGISGILHDVAAQGVSGSEPASANAATEKLLQEKQQLQEALHQEAEGRKKDKEAHESKKKSLAHLCVSILQQRQKRLENTLQDLRKEVHSQSVFPSRLQKDAEISRLHRLVGEFSETMSNDFKATVEAAAKMLGHPISGPPKSTPERTEIASKEIAAALATEDESTEDEQDNTEQDDQKETKKKSDPKKLYSTDWVDKHPNETFHHRASGRWLKGLPGLDASPFTGVRGPGASEWKEMMANKPKPPKPEKDTTPQKKTEQGPEIKGEFKRPGMPASQMAQGQANRKMQQLEALVRDLQFKLKELRVKLDEEVGARRKAEAELESLRKEMGGLSV